MIWLPPVTIGVFSTQSNWSVWPSGWQLAQENVPVVDAAAVLNAMRPCFTIGSVGSSSVTDAVTLRFAGSARSTRETVLATAFNTHAWLAFPSLPDIKASPRGTASTSTLPSISPEAALTVNTLSDPAAVATIVLSSSLT